MAKKSNAVKASAATANEFPDASKMTPEEMMRFIAEFQASLSSSIVPVEDGKELVKQEDDENPDEIVRLCISASKRDAQWLREHRAQTGETASGFVRRMIAEQRQSI